MQGSWFRSDTKVYEPQIRALLVPALQSTEEFVNRELNRTVQLSVPPEVTLLRVQVEEGRYNATWKKEFKLPWRKAGPLKSSR